MWTELLEELVYGILDQPTIQSVHSLYHWNLVVCEDVPAGCDPQPLEQVSVLHNKPTILLSVNIPPS